MLAPKNKRRLFKLTIVVASFLITIVVVEVLLRIGKFPSCDVHSVNAKDYERIPGMYEPNQDFESYDKPALAYRVKINSLGLRGPETTLKPQKTRILCIGDSFTYGDFVENDETLPAQIERFLGEDFEVLNGGVRGTTVVDQQVFLQRLLALEPDAVVLTYCEPNDLKDLFWPVPAHEQIAKYRKLKSGLLSPLFTVIKDTCLFRQVLLAEAIARRKNNQQENNPDPSHALSNIPKYVDTLSEIRDQLKQQDIPFYFVTFPWDGKWLGKTDGLSIGPLVEAIEPFEIVTIDPTPQFTASGLSMDELYCLPHDGHPAAKGYEVCGRVVADVLREHFASAGGEEH